MKKLITLALILPILCNITIGEEMTEYKPPKTIKNTVTDTLHGHIIKDDYRWLEDKSDPKVRDWSEKQHKATVDYILNNGIKALSDRDYRSSPFFIGNREFFYARKKGEQHNTFYTIIDYKEVKLFSPIDLDDSGNTSLSGMDLTEDGNIAAIGTQYKGDEIQTYRLINTKTGEKIGNDIVGLRGFKFAKDESFAYITVQTREMIDNQKPIQVYKHKLGTDRKNDLLLAEPSDAKDIASV